jgi:glutamate-1-semialdehyde 2,1-aminomutase
MPLTKLVLFIDFFLRFCLSWKNISNKGLYMNSAVSDSPNSSPLLGGVSSSFRINPFTGKPIYAANADGPFITDLNGKKYTDFFMGHGAIPLGHNRREIMRAIIKALDYGFTAEYDTDLTVKLAEKICVHIPCAEKVRFTNSGSEATLLAVRLARGFTGREKIVRIDGHFHGTTDYFLANNLAGKIDRGNAGCSLSKIGGLSSGVPAAIKDTLFIIPWNDAAAFENLAKEKHEEIACIIMNPIDYNNGCITVAREYLLEIRDICERYGIVLIFDEILSGFRTGISCAQGYYGVTPDICTLGKALSNGVPIAAITGREKVMSKIMDPHDPVIAGGTFSGNLLGASAGIAALTIMEQPGFFDEWLGRTAGFFGALQSLFDASPVSARVQYLGSNFFIYFGTREPVTDYHEFSKLDNLTARKFFVKCIEKGLYFHTDFTVSAMHDEKTLDRALNKIEKIIKEVAS